ncbi:hypothetical protein BpHYR1_021994 [Brachionus plicatilis]|uniref:Uncharacterized protein n=1 Tax=Brachionus plicatilis TaxID=10195 RepID=A0A3M7RF79_BRAPC|nr:hypothetical protein BpHYR1_021994 [Brachionus plicatilis]
MLTAKKVQFIVSGEKIAKKKNLIKIKFLPQKMDFFGRLILPVLRFKNQHVDGTKDVSVITIYRTCFDPSEFELWDFLHFVFVFCTKIHNAFFG